MEKSKKLRVLLVMMVLILKNMWSCDCCLENERNALLQLMSSFNSSLLSYSSRAVDCCNWRRVQCNPTTGRVIQLDLYGIGDFSSSGDWYLNASLFLPFQQLQNLDLGRNNIAGCLHNEGFERLSTLSNLESLYLSFNSFNNSILSSLAGLSSLKFLSLSGNKLKGTTNIEELNGLSKLEELYLDGNEITKFVGPTDKRGHSILSTLYLDYITIEGEGRSMLLESLGVFPHLKTLSLKLWNFKGIIIGQVLLNNVSQVEELYLEDSSLDENSLLSLGATMPSLKLLSMNSIYLNGSLPSQGICKLEHLEELFIDSNNLSGNLPMCLANLSSLQVLDLSFNHFTGNIFMSPLRGLTSLKNLYLLNNLFQIPISLTPFFNHSQLQVLDTSDNTIYAETEDHNVTPRFQLEWLVLSGQGNGGAIPKFLYHQYNLQYVDLSNNKIEGEFPYWLLENNTNLEVLFLANNSLSGSLRLPIHPHMNFSNLDISDNCIRGYIPSKFGVYLPSLRRLDMSGNEFNGSIPSSFGNMSLLKSLDLSKNILSGEISSWINMSSLQILVLSRNNISGSIPPNLCPQRSIGVHLSKNKLQGSLVDTYHDCPSLGVLDLSHNNFMGRIPKWIGMTYSLNFVFLNHNNLEGEIPIELCNLDKLSFIDISYNNLSGKILPCIRSNSDWYKQQCQTKGSFPILQLGYPQTMELTTKNELYNFQRKTLRLFAGIDLSSNNFSGEIPPEIGNLGTIQMLNLSHNNLIGSIPPTFSNLRQIESLDLSYNKLNGKIPHQLTELKFLEVFSIAHNNLSGKTPERVAQFATFERGSYEENPFLCGEPLPKSCNSTISSPMAPATSQDEKEENGFIDMDVFYVSFVVSYIIVLLGIGSVLYINPYWRRAWFYFVEQTLTRSYYFLIYNIPLLSKFGLS